MTALNEQIGGNHYKDFAIQPVEFIHRNEIDFISGNVIKYICRWKSKGGINDLEKAKHYIELLIELSTNKSEETEKKISFNKNDAFTPTSEKVYCWRCPCTIGSLLGCDCECHKETKDD